MTEPTPGPWRIDAELDKSIAIYGPGHDSHNYERLECEVSTDDVDRETARANARLIVTAPDLLAALVQAKVELGLLKSVIQSRESWTERLDGSYQIMMNQIEAARAKVRGE